MCASPVRKGQSTRLPHPQSTPPSLIWCLPSDTSVSDCCTIYADRVRCWYKMHEILESSDCDEVTTRQIQTRRLSKHNTHTHTSHPIVNVNTQGKHKIQSQQPTHSLHVSLCMVHKTGHVLTDWLLRLPPEVWCLSSHTRSPPLSAHHSFANVSARASIRRHDMDKLCTMNKPCWRGGLAMSRRNTNTADLEYHYEIRRLLMDVFI